MKAFPDVCVLARADEQEVLSHSARGFGSCFARAAISSGPHGGRSWNASTERSRVTSPLCASSPVSGPYTAAAVAAFAFDECVAVLDADVIRVVARRANFKKPVTSAPREIASWEDSRAACFPESDGRIHTSALMDLGAMVCKAGIPDCCRVPVRKFCKAEREKRRSNHRARL